MFFRVSLILLIFFHYLYAYDITAPSFSKNDQINSLTNLINNCYSDVKAIIIADLLTDSRSEDLYRKTIGSVTLLKNLTDYSIPIGQRAPVPLIILMVTSSAELKGIFVNETWRDFDQSFIILDSNSDNGCMNAKLFLMEAWKNDVLNIIFICLNREDRVPKIYSFNPFTDFAPSPWQKVSEISVTNNRSWVLINRSFRGGVAVCRNLFFEKTNNCGGHVIQAGGQYIKPYIWSSMKNGIRHLEGFDLEITKLLFGNLNVSISFEMKFSNTIREYNRDLNRHLLEELKNKMFDYSVNSVVLNSNTTPIECSYAFYQTGFSVITKRRELKKITSHLFSFLPFNILALFYIVNTLIFLLLRYLIQDPYSQHLIDAFRVFLNLPLPAVPLTIHGRFVFGLTLISFTITNIVIQSHMNTVLTSSNAAQNIEGITDLIKLNFQVYARGKSLELMKEIGLTNVELAITEFTNCSQLKAKEAFASKEISLLPLMTRNCHMPRKPIIPARFLIYCARRNWPIFPKVNKNLLMLFEGGLTDYHIKKALAQYQRSYQDQPDKYQVITMDHMTHTFYGFIISNIIAMVILGIELFIARLSRSINQIFDLSIK